jgi:integrase
MNSNALVAILELRDRTKKLFGDNIPQDWFVFPRAEGFMRPDPTKPMRTWRTAWRALTKSAGLSAFRFHDLRHHAITELAESRASDQTIMAIAGHLSARMLNHYSHVRLDIRRAALDTLSAAVVWIPDSKTPNGTAEVPLTSFAIEAFKNQMAIAGEAPYLFPSDLNSTGHLKKLKTVWTKTLRRAKIPYFRIYDLRSAYATRLSAGGIADEWVTQLLRQSDAQVFKSILR